MSPVDVLEEAKEYAKAFCTELDKCPDEYHMVNWAKENLIAHEFVELHETDIWKLEPEKGYFFTRNMSSLVAFRTPKAAPKGVNLFKFIGTHTDACQFRLAPKSKMTAFGMEQFAVQIYGSPLIHTWLDRDLALSGKVIVKDDKGKMSTRLYRSPDKVLRIPNVAIHLIPGNDFIPDLQSHINPIFATQEVDKALTPDLGAEYPHPSALMKHMAETLKVKPAQIVDCDLNISEALPAALGGWHEEFVCAGRLDNMSSSIVAVDTIINMGAETGNEISMVFLFDHEEVGSQSAQGAGSSLVQEVP